MYMVTKTPAASPVVSGEVMRNTPAGVPGPITWQGPALPTGADLPPANVTLREFGHDILALPGTQFTGWSISKPSSLHIHVDSPEWAELLRNVLRPAIDGVNIDLETSAAAADAQRGASEIAWPDNPSNKLRMLLALPGVHEHSASVATMTATFWTNTADQAQHLSRLINDTFAGWTVQFRQGRPSGPGVA